MIRIRRSRAATPAQNGGGPQPISVAAPVQLEGERRWWEDKGYTLFNGVFEGGGAKGLLYVGALDALRAEKMWFRAVAGTSVGSIIAALIASGLTVEQFGSHLMSMLSTFPPLRGLRSYKLLRKQAGIFEPAELHDKLEEVFAQQVVIQSGQERADADAPVTFRELFKATKMELNVLAIDIFERREVVFNHKVTPNCQVADAVLASSAIPGFFPPGRLAIERSESVRLANPIVDGGVWANFPLFVFRDERFREFHGLPELKTSGEKQLMGFLLEESQLISTGQRKARFARPLKKAQFAKEGQLVLPAEVILFADDTTVIELVDLAKKPDIKVEELSWKVKHALGTQNRLLKPFDPMMTLVSSMPLAGDSKTAELPWLSVLPGHRSKVMRSLRFTSQLMRGVLGPVILALVLAMLILGSIAIFHAFRQQVLLDWATLLGVSFPYLLFIVPCTVVAVLGMASLLVGNFYFARVTERYGYLVASTLASAGSVRYWMDGDSVADPETTLPLTTIVRIPVPEDLNTLSFRYVNVDFALALARASVTEQLQSLRNLPTSSSAQKTREERAVETSNTY